MKRVRWIALSFVLGFACSSSAAVIISADAGVDTPGFAGYKTYQLRAISDEYPIVAADFAGDGSTTGPGAKGFFGAMNQLVIFGGVVPTIFADSNAVIDGQSNWSSRADSQFSVKSTDVVVKPGLAKETTNFLQAAWAWPASPGLTVPIAQLVIPNVSSGIAYNGTITVDMNGVLVDVPVSGAPNPPPLFTPWVDNITVSTLLGQTVELTPVDVGPGTPAVTWRPLTGPGYTRDFGASGSALGLGTAAWSWDPATQKFIFNTLGASVGRYVWEGAARNAVGVDYFLLTVNVLVPEPNTLLLAAVVAILSLSNWRPVKNAPSVEQNCK